MFNYIKFPTLILNILCSALTIESLKAQVLCISCYHQNERVLTDDIDLLLNGSFENGCNAGDLFCPNSFEYECDLSNWMCTGGGVNTYASCISTLDVSLVVEGEKAAYFGNSFSASCSSPLDTSCFIQIGCEVSGIPAGYPLSDPDYGATEGVSLEQTVTGLITGSNYELEFWAGGEAFPQMVLASGLFAVDVGFGKIYLRDPATPSGNGIGIRYVILFKAASSSTKIKFTNWGHIHFEATELILDDVRLIKSSEQGNPCSTSTKEADDDQFFTIQPNPFHDNGYLLLNSNESQQGHLLIYNVLGKLVSQINILTNSTLIQCNTLSNGVYFFQLALSNHKLRTGKFVIE